MQSANSQEQGEIEAGAPSSCGAGHGALLQPCCRADIQYTAVDAGWCSCQPDVGGLELSGCQLASNGVNSREQRGRPRSGTGLLGAARLAWLVHMDAAGGGDGVTDHTLRGFLVAGLPEHSLSSTTCTAVAEVGAAASASRPKGVAGVMGQ
jgi:hypothetical protein